MTRPGSSRPTAHFFDQSDIASPLRARASTAIQAGWGTPESYAEGHQQKRRLNGRGDPMPVGDREAKQERATVTAPTRMEPACWHVGRGSPASDSKRVERPTA
jgi:hypothetical protein